jgi:endoglucanase
VFIHVLCGQSLTNGMLYIPCFLMRSVIYLILLCGIMSAAYGQSNPLKLATQARFDLTASTETGSIDGGQIVTGAGTVARMNWIPVADQPRSYTVHFSTPHFAWTECEFRFTAASNGTVTLKLIGPWEPSPDSGPIYRQEIYWDALSASNTTLPNGSFEQVSAGIPDGWTRPYGDAESVSGPVPAVDGVRYVRTWHDGPLTISLPVTNGLPVVLRFYARAVVPTNYIDMARITDTNTPAHQAARKLMRGANLGNYLEAPPGQNWGASYSTNDFAWIWDEGFDHVRIPIGWHHYTGSGPGYTLTPEIYEKADFLVTNALAKGLGVIVNTHHFDEFTTDPATYSNKFYAIWRQVAEHYSNAPPELVFELINEPKDAATTVVMNPIYAEAIRQIRLSNPDRAILVGPGQFNSIDELTNVLLPDGDSNLVVTVHNYSPFLFTHQGATWPGPDTATTGIQFPGPPASPLAPAAGVASWVTNWINDYNILPEDRNPSHPREFQSKLQLARQWSDYYGRPVHIGEFGAYATYCDDASRLNYYREFRAAADTQRLGWAMWDWKAGFHYWVEEDGSGAPDPPGMRESMFPPPELSASARGGTIVNGAIAKTYVFEKTHSLTSGVWSAASTQVCNSVSLEFTDPDAASSTNTFYRAQWIKHP